MSNLYSLNTMQKKFVELVTRQHGDITKLKTSKTKYDIKSLTEGYLIGIDAYKLGVLSMHLGAGRQNKEDTIDYGAGIIVHKNINDYVKNAFGSPIKR